MTQNQYSCNYVSEWRIELLHPYAIIILGEMHLVTQNEWAVSLEVTREGMRSVAPPQEQFFGVYSVFMIACCYWRGMAKKIKT